MTAFARDVLWGCVAMMMGCSEHQLAACPGQNPDDLCPSPCSASAECAARAPGRPVCDLDAMTCVQCTPAEPAACTAATPVCGADHACRACAAHAECPGSNVCLPAGACADPGQVAYVQPAALGGTDNPSCTRAQPCLKVGSALQTGRPYVKLAGTTDEGGTLTIDNRDVTLLADPGAKLVRTSNGLHVEIKGTSQVTIEDLEISGASGAQGVGLSLPAGNTATLTLRRVQLANNTGGGLTASNAAFVIIGNVFFQNGTGSGTTGGVTITAPQNSANRLEFNSFNGSQTQLGVGAAIQCVAGAFTAKNNIMSENGTLTNLEQVGGACLHAYSIVRPGTLPPGTGNSSADPLFKDTTRSDLHLRPGSPALGAADPAADLTGPAARDIDGDRRVAPAALGADEAP